MDSSDQNLHDTFHKDLDLLQTDDHDCFSIMQQETAGLPNVVDEPLTNPELILYIDGSRFADDEGRFHTGFAVTNSRYTIGIAHDFRPIWAARDFITASGTTLKHHETRGLLHALQLPKVVAILKVKADGKLNTAEAGSNNMADMEAKEAAKGRQYGEVGKVVEPDGYYMVTEDKKFDKMMSWDLFKKLQDQAPNEEKENWMRKGATHEEGRVYAMDSKSCLPQSMYPMVVQ
ncbi:unnamed protein product [Ranitomeya imitator]|uniref:Uncharacterized protein n=1 Tax=Ranitomeya imitator TaxID=111125 RepID=A0ABN9MTE8_9NEOB|nr:unnamed protein product [Ranitomeya imitator]